ncbi:protein SCO1/2 [Oxalobacteraceae bacterium GrIS 1.11]
MTAPTSSWLAACGAWLALAGQVADAGVAAASPSAPASLSLYAQATHWTDDSGKTVTLDQWRGRPVLMTMAYSTCRRTCSLTLKQLEILQTGADRAGRAIDIVVVSYDPKNDTPVSWASYRRARGLSRTNWHFLTGGEGDTKRLSHWLGLADFWSLEDHIMHDFKISVLDADGNIVRQLGWQDLNVPLRW